MLAGKTRIRLLRCLYENPGQNVSDLAKKAQIGVSDASQELRRIQSRGILRPQYKGASLLYRLAADPQVRSAAPILKALRATLSMDTPDKNEKIIAIAKGFGHLKRIRIIKSLINAPKTTFALQKELGTSFRTTSRHRQVLLETGLIRRDNRTLHYIPSRHPLAQALVKLLPD